MFHFIESFTRTSTDLEPVSTRYVFAVQKQTETRQIFQRVLTKLDKIFSLRDRVHVKTLVSKLTVDQIWASPLVCCYVEDNVEQESRTVLSTALVC